MNGTQAGPKVIILFILSSTEHEISTAHKSKLLETLRFFHFNIYEQDKFLSQLNIDFDISCENRPFGFSNQQQNLKTVFCKLLLTL